jgi:hypothetical protein
LFCYDYASQGFLNKRPVSKNDVVTGKKRAAAKTFSATALSLIFLFCYYT